MFISFYQIIYLLFILFTFVLSNEQCCKDLGVPEVCYSVLCNPTVEPTVIQRYKLFERLDCQDWLEPVSKCLARGRDSSSCCYKKSFDNEFDYCFGLCNGTQTYSKFKKNDLISCFVVNVPAIFPCIVSSYEAAPSEPRELEIASKTETSVSIQWKEPKELVDLVYLYKVHLVERNGGKEISTTYDTKDLEFTLDDVVTTSSYSVHVVAHAEDYNGKAGWYKSAISNIVLFTTGPELELANEILRTPANTKKVQIPCHLKKIFGQVNDIEWRKFNGDNHEQVENDQQKYSIITYYSKTQKDTMVSALQINKFEESDFGIYRCYIKDTRIEYRQTVVTKYAYSEESPPENPPDTLLECCRKGARSDGCPSLCNGESVEEPDKFRPHYFVPTPKKCESEIELLFKCTLNQYDSAGCCMHSGVPYHCLGMCDTRFNISFSTVASCRNWVGKIYNCQLALMDLKPEAVSFVKTTFSSGYTWQFTWETVLDAKVFHVYSRKNGQKWDSRVTLDHAVDITDADEAILIAVNEFGTSAPHRFHYENDVWQTLDN